MATTVGPDLASRGATDPVEAVTFEYFMQLPDELRAEYADGRITVTPPPTFGHQMALMRLYRTLFEQLPGEATIVQGVGWMLPTPTRRVRIPDLMLLDAPPAGDVVTAAPVAVVEVVSTNRADDLRDKVVEYHEARARQYWTVDPRDRVIVVRDWVMDGWRETVRLTDAAPHARVDVPGFGEVEVSLHAVLDGSATGL